MDVQGMEMHLVTHDIAYGVLYLLNSRIAEFLHFSAAVTDHMIMLAVGM